MSGAAPFEALDAYESGEMSDADSLGFEEELFSAAAAGQAAAADFVDQVSRLGHFLLGRGGFDIGSTRARVDELIARGLRVQVMSPDPGAIVGGVMSLPAITDDAQIVVTHIPLDVRGYESVDVIIEKPDGTPLKTFRDIGWDPSDGSIYAVCEAPLARISAAAGRLRSTVVGKRAGQEHIVAVFEAQTGP